MSNKATFTPMNAVIKGAPADVRAALAMEGMPKATVLDAIDDSKTIACVKVEYDIFEPCYMQPGEIPYASMPGIKFVMLGDGGSEYESDGTYAIFKGFGSGIMAQRFTYCSIHMEEIADSLGDTICRSFLTSAWSYEYIDYSCGEEGYFEWDNPWKEMWEDDSAFKADGKYGEIAALETVTCVCCGAEEMKQHASEVPYVGDDEEVPPVLPICHKCRAQWESIEYLNDWDSLRVTNAYVIEDWDDTEKIYIMEMENTANGAVAQFEGGELSEVNGIPAYAFFE